MESIAVYSRNASPFLFSSRITTHKSFKSSPNSATFSPVLIQSMATQKPPPPVAKTVGSRKGSSSSVFPLGESGPRNITVAAEPVKLLKNVEKLKLLTKAEKAGLLSAAEKFGLSLSSIEKLGLLSKAEELGVLSAATDTGTPGALLTLSLGLLLLGPSCVYLVPEDNVWEIMSQIVVAAACVVGGSAAFAASNLVSNLQKSS
ncbi:RNA binding protein, putative isoform 1 [Hibiscus syriacus]|uniref:RNA binding protein, putative isoform 1 n=1 Tax=Hibiscus syriacus TaxID=106335 RepID=A0A6A2XA04_HIBSY|nr:uncharacterized protein LOC120172193 isoform X2 [Hibiscus syriacus]KAE8672331.1 RNA binding protein, putative isoform 1 [Hibiscus syriacus]